MIDRRLVEEAAKCQESSKDKLILSLAKEAFQNSPLNAEQNLDEPRAWNDSHRWQNSWRDSHKKS